jgi:molybdate transport system substrate-binding protein
MGEIGDEDALVFRIIGYNPTIRRSMNSIDDRRRFLRQGVAALLIALLASLSGCKHSNPEAQTKEEQLVVFAAASLRDVFTSLGERFKQAHPGVTITFNFAGTQELRTQLEQGAEVDVFASADHRHMAELTHAGRVSSPKVFARNEPVIVVAKESLTAIGSLADLPNASRIVIGAPDVPIGRYTLQILDRATTTLGSDFKSRVEAKVVSRELNVRQVLTKISLGEADAGIVYRTDALTAKDSVGLVTIPPEVNVIAEYPSGVVMSAKHPTLARAWVDLVLSGEGKTALAAAGFMDATP